MDEMKSLILTALAARRQAYAPYSHYKVGAALLCSDGTVYTGCNIENAAYSPSLCAERVAFAKAVSDVKATGKPGAACAEDYDWRSRFKAIAIVGGQAGSEKTDFCTPCGVCRQVMEELCSPDFTIACASTDKDGNVTQLKRWSLKELLPEGFDLNPTLS